MMEKVSPETMLRQRNGIALRRNRRTRWMAQFNLGVFIAKGDGVAKNESEATEWFRRAAEQGLAEAQYNLGVCYANGDGVPENYVEARKWIGLAAMQGDEDAKQTLPIIERRMTSGQIAEAQRLAREFKARKPVQKGGLESR
jgi:uncharacterized protein